MLRIDRHHSVPRGIAMRPILPGFLVSLTIVSRSQTAFSEQPISKGEWTYKNGEAESVMFDYGTELSADDIDRLSSCTSISEIR